MLDGPDFLGWLNAPEGVMARAVLSIGKAAERIAELGETLVIVGSGDAPARGAGGDPCARKEGECGLAFAGTSLSPNAYEQLCSGLEGHGLLPAPDRADCCRYGVRRCLPRCPLAA